MDGTANSTPTTDEFGSSARFDDSLVLMIPKTLRTLKILTNLTVVIAI